MILVKLDKTMKWTKEVLYLGHNSSPQISYISLGYVGVAIYVRFMTWVLVVLVEQWH